MGSSPAAVVLTSLEDLWLEPEPQNIPGTHRERPNWQRRFSRTLVDAFTDPHVVDSLRALDRARRSDDSRKDDT